MKLFIGQKVEVTEATVGEPFKKGDILTVGRFAYNSDHVFYSEEYPEIYCLGHYQVKEPSVHVPNETHLKNSGVVSRFSFHKPDAAGIASMKQIRIKVRSLAKEIDALCPESKEKATALTQLSFVMMAANSAIVQQYPVDENDLDESEKEAS